MQVYKLAREHFIEKGNFSCNRTKLLALGLTLILLFLGTVNVARAETYVPTLKWGTYGYDNGQFICPTGIAVDASGNVYVADMCQNRIQKFTSQGVYLMSFYGPSDSQFNNPRGLLLMVQAMSL